MAQSCTHCRADPGDTGPLFVDEGASARRGPFCSYACLSLHIEDADLIRGAMCEV